MPEAPPRSRAAVARRAAGALVAFSVVGAALVVARGSLAELVTAGGEGTWQRPLAVGPEASAVPHAPVRVVVLDGLTRADARGPALDALCARGMDLVIDVGFPTKSLPVQTVLWSGLTAQQSGMPMRNQLDRALTTTLPARLPGARAVVEAWPQIAHSAGFAQVDTIEAAAEAVAGEAPLVLVHVLAIDAAGHRGGRDHAYREEIARSDVLLGELVARAPDATWVVLSDHGHLPRGGHGDAEPEVRLVRGCVEPRPPGAPARGDVHLVDVSRHLHDTLAVTPPRGAVGRPLAEAAVAPDRDATLPRPSRGSIAIAIVVLLLGAAATVRWGQPRAAAIAPGLALVAYVVVFGPPSLSWRQPTAALGLGALASVVVLACPGARLHPARVIALVVPALAVVVAAGVVAGVPAAVFGGPPPRLPYVTAWSQILVGTATPALLAGVTLLGALVSGRRTR